jgi:ubiquinone/menaquinone biosynthesis C-methylase UbiE
MPDQKEVLEQQRKAWDTMAPGWDKWDAFFMCFMKSVGDGLLDAADVRTGNQVLDAATGTGEPGLSAAKRVGPGGRVEAFDLSQEMVNIAAANGRKQGLANFHAQTGDATHLAYPDASFDAAVCRFGIMFFPDPVLCLKELGRTIKPGGKLAVATWSGAEKNTWISSVSKAVHETLHLPAPGPDQPSLFRFAAPGSVEKVLADSGFKEARQWEISGEVAFDSPEAQWQIITEMAAPVASALAKANAEQKAEVREKVLANARSKMKDGRPTFPWCAWLAVGKK